MNSRCACCGDTGKTEQHHIGGRKHSIITIPLCPQCHNLATIADNYARDWKSAGTVAWRIGTGFLDLASIVATNAGLPVTMRFISDVIDALPEQVAGSRVPASVPDYPGSDDPMSCVRIINAAMEAWRADILRRMRLSPLDLAFINLVTQTPQREHDDRP